MINDTGPIKRECSYKGFPFSISTWGGPDEYSGIATIPIVDGNDLENKKIELEENFDTRAKVWDELTKRAKQFIDKLIE